MKRPGDTIKISAKRGDKMKHFDVVLRNKAGKSELVARETFDAVTSLGGEFANINLSDKQKKELGIKGGIQVTRVASDGLLGRAKVQRGYIITHINGTAIYSVNDLYRITAKITSIEGVYPNGRSVTYSLVE
jgi:C-terminal processing protease CtpA/Prc